jgi:hypothetical protein
MENIYSLDIKTQQELYGDLPKKKGSVTRILKSKI